MKFTEETVFPVFTKCKESFHYICYFSIFANVVFRPSVEDVNFRYDNSIYEPTPEESQITKEEFIEANKELLQKTGLINLFESNFPKYYVDDLSSLVKEKDCKISKLELELEAKNEEIDIRKRKANERILSKQSLENELQEKQVRILELVEGMSKKDKWINHLEKLSTDTIADNLRYKALIDKFILKV